MLQCYAFKTIALATSHHLTMKTHTIVYIDHLQCDGPCVDSSCIWKCHSCRLGGLGVRPFFRKKNLAGVAHIAGPMPAQKVFQLYVVFMKNVFYMS